MKYSMNPIEIVIIYIYIYIYREREREMKNKVIQKEEFNEKESQRYNVSVQMNHHQDWEGWYLAMFNYWWMFNKIRNKEEISCI